MQYHNGILKGRAPKSPQGSPKAQEQRRRVMDSAVGGPKVRGPADFADFAIPCFQDIRDAVETQVFLHSDGCI